MLRSYSIYILLFFGIAISNCCFAQVEDLKIKADQAYIEGNYLVAAESYEQILSQEYVSAEVHYNLGNAYFKSGQIAASILNYERALKLAPSDEDITFNLKLANLSVKDKIEVMPRLFFLDWWELILQTFSTDGWAWSAVVALILGLSGLLLFKFSTEVAIRRSTFYVGIITLLWAIFSVYAAQRSFDHIENDNRAVVFASTINVKSAPDVKGKDLFVIHEGLVVSVSERVNGWVRIRLANGNVGWMAENALIAI